MNEVAAGAVLSALLEAITGKKETKWENIDTGLDYAGKKLILPSDPAKMPIPVAISSLKRIMADEEQETNVHEKIMAHPLEAAVAFVEAMKELYGVVSPVSQPGFFGPQLPEFLSVQTDLNEWVQVPWGAFKIPGIENKIVMSADRDSKGRLHLVVYGTVRKRERHVLLELAAKTREILKAKSIYKGKAIHIVTDGDGELDLNNPPSFVDLRDVDASALILNGDVEDQVATNIWAPLRHTRAIRKDPDMTLRRNILLEGQPGIGKTMLARITAAEAVKHGWTFITIDRPASLKEALLFAQRYQPAMVFVEDIDRVMKQRDDIANEILNIVSGVLSTRDEIMVVFTTNYVDLIDQTMLRPGGRVDSVISIGLPDPTSVGRLIRRYARGTLAANEPLDRIGQELAGWTPAVVGEVVKRSKLAMIAGSRNQLIEDDLLISVRGMKNHLELLKPKVAEVSINEKLGMAFRGVIEDTLTGGLGNTAGDSQQAEAIQNGVNSIYLTLRRGLVDLHERHKEAVAQARSNATQVKGLNAKVSDTHEIVKHIDDIVS
jgi:hypothetical protein